MRLTELLSAQSISIQCHDNPDADAIASGYALYCYFEANGKTPFFFYKGKSPISKPNLRMMIAEFDINIIHAPYKEKVDGLLITVDCQYGGGNVGHVEAGSVAVIDHHVQSQPLPPLHILHSSLAACSTLVWHMLCEERFNINLPLATALHYGLYCDSNGMSEIGHILDRNLRDIMNADVSTLRRLKSSNLTLDDLATASAALRDLKYCGEGRFIIVPVVPCDQNLLGFISDLAMQVDGVDIAVVFFETTSGIKFSVRTTTREVKASDLAQWLTQNGIGSGGGHEEKAGGWIDRKKYQEKELPDTSIIYFRDSLERHLAAYTVVDCLKKELPPVSAFEAYTKLPVELGVVSCLPFCTDKATLHIRMLEGDIIVKMHDGLMLMIGLAGEVYPIARDTFASRYTLLDKPFRPNWEHKPTVRDTESGKNIVLTEHAHTCLSKEGQVLALQLTQGIKLFTSWDSNKYMKGEPGDWLVRSPDNSHDMYVVTQDMWQLLYRSQDAKK